jgi:hypothetical protein
MSERYGLKPEQLGAVIESTIGGLGIPGAGKSEESQQSREESSLVNIVVSRVEEAERTMWPYYKKWALNTEYYADNPFAAWNPRKKSVIRQPRHTGSASTTLHPVSYNLFKSYIGAIVARFASTRPQILIKPGSSEEEVIEGARIAQRILSEYEWERQSMEEILSEMIPNLTLHGTTVLKVTWNDKAGKFLGDTPIPAIVNGEPIAMKSFNPMTGMYEEQTDEHGEPIWAPEVDAMGQPVTAPEWEGNVETQVVMSRDFLVDPTATAFKTARWCIHKYEMSPADIYDKWEVAVSPSSDPDKDAGGGSNFGYARRMDDTSKSTTTIYELWLRPGTYKFGPNPGDAKHFDKGFVIIATADTLLDSGPNPYDHGEFPFVFIPALRIPGELYGDTVANSMRMLQNSFNKTGSQIVQANDLMGNPQWLLPNGCKMPDQDRVNKAGIHKRYEAGLGGERPEIIPGTGVSPSVWRYFDTLRSLFQEISGVREGGLGGGAPASIESGKALNALIERDVSKLASMGLELGRGIKQWAWLSLHTIQQHWADRRTVSVVGHYNTAEVVSFGGLDVYDSFDVSVTPESTMPQTEAMKQAKAADLLDRQLIKPYEYLRRLGEDSAEDTGAEVIDVANARMENANARRHGVIPIMSVPDQMEVEDHAIHMEEHRRELLNPALRRDHMKWQALKEHHDLHMQMSEQIAQEAMAQQAQMAQAGGPQAGGQEMSGPDTTPPPPPGGSLPLG